MTYQVLSRKWRPQKFQDVVGQSHITQSLINALKQHKLGHAYLFTGTRGIGKTTVARIFAKALRCENLLDDGNPCGTCASCKDFDTGSSMNVYEIDGASNNSVDDIRDLISNVQYLPTTGKYKVYVIDEVHMLSTSAFNALLKTLEEPPEHVVFLFATTEPHKLLETVLSRCQRYDFKNATNTEISFLLKNIAKEEGISFSSDEIIEQLALQGKGSFRDTLSLLDQVLSFSLDGKINEEVIASALGLAMQSEIKNLLEAVLVGDNGSFQESYHLMLNRNVSLENILRGLQDHLYKIIDNIDNSQKVAKFVNPDVLTELSMAELLWVYETFAKDFPWTLASLSPENSSEIVLKKVCFRRDLFSNTDNKIDFGKKKTNIQVTEDSPETEVQTAPSEVLEEPAVETASEPLEEVISQEQPEPLTVQETVVEKSYHGFLEFVNAISPATASNLEQGNISGEPEYIVGESVSLEITFADDSKVFYDFLHEPEVFNKVAKYLADYYAVEAQKATLNLNLLEDETAKTDFVSVAEIKRQEEEKALKDQEESLRNSPMIKEAERLFSARVDKIVLNKE